MYCLKFYKINVKEHSITLLPDPEAQDSKGHDEAHEPVVPEAQEEPEVQEPNEPVAHQEPVTVVQ